MNLKLHGIVFFFKFTFNLTYIFLVYRFAQFFISPLLKEDSMKREIQAVESGEDFTCILYTVHINNYLRGHTQSIIVHDCTPCIILTVGILQIMQNYYSPRKLDFVFSKI